MTEKEVTTRIDPSDKAPDKDMVWLEGGTFTMGSNDHYPEESPTHPVSVDGFWIDKHPVTNRLFTRFVQQTGYVTFAEHPPIAEDYPDADPELLVPGSLVFQQPPGPVDLRDHFQWWAYVPGANWRQPEGPGTSLKGRGKHPVVHVTHEDAAAYANWAHKELVTEAQFEFAARGGLEEKVFVWGNEYAPNGKVMANHWQGQFPWQNLKEDGYERTSPVGAFPANGYGLYDLAGNVWEWTDDWFSSAHPEDSEHACCGAPINPRGGPEEGSYGPTHDGKFPRKVLKGGSFLCADNYCMRYRPAARHPEPIDSSTNHIGFRCVVNVNGG